MINSLFNFLGCNRRRKQSQELASEMQAMKELQEKQKKYQARIADEEDWFKKICVEKTTSCEVLDGRIENPIPVHSSS